MTPEEMPIAIAEACRWKRSDTMDYCLYGIVARGKHLEFPNREPAYVRDGIVTRTSLFQGYLHDMNTRAEMLNVLAERNLGGAFASHFIDKWDALIVSQPSFCEKFCRTLFPERFK